MVGDREEFVLLAERGGARRNIIQISLWVVLACALVIVVVPPMFVRCSGGSAPLNICKNNLKNIGTALEMYSCDWSGHYPRNLETLVPEYLSVLPECPAAGYVTYRATFGAAAPTNPEGFQDYYYLECAGQNHDGLAPNEPYYDGLRCVLGR